MGQNRSELTEVLQRIVKELYDVKESLSDLKKETFQSNERMENPDGFYKEIVNSLIKSNLELHAKMSELIIVINGLSKDLKELLEIFKEAALFYMERKPSSKSKEIDKKIEELEASNRRMLEILDKLSKELEELKKEKEKKEDRLIRRPIPPPPHLPRWK